MTIERKPENWESTVWKRMEKGMEVNNELRLNVDKQQDDIKYLKEECNKHNKDKVQEISGAGTFMKKNKSVCVTCNKSL